MTWLNTWAIEGSQTSADVGRLLAWHAVDGYTGIGAPTDLAVRQLDVPGGQVRVMPGTASFPCNALGKSYQVYVGSNPTVDYVDVPATGTSGPRTDLIVARVENPIAGEPWQTPPDPLTAVYVRSHRYHDVDPAVIHVNQVDPAASAITLARITLPASTGAITDAMVTDLRKPGSLAQDVAENKIWTDSYYHGADADVLLPSHNVFRFWPANADFTIPIPKWATTMDVDAAIVNAEQQINVVGEPGHIWGEMRMNIGPGTGAGLLYTPPTEFDQDFPLSHDNFPNLSPTSVFMPIVGKVAIPAELRGTTQRFRFEARQFLDVNTKGKVTARRGGHSKLLVNFKTGAVY